MNVKISSNHEFLAGFWIPDELEFNHYTVNIDMLTATNDVLEQNIAFLRLRHILEVTLSNVIFVAASDTDRIELFESADLRVAVTPTEPVDQIIGMILHAKLGAVLDGRIQIRSIKLSSVKGDGIVYEHDDAEYNPLMSETGWWTNNDPDDIKTVGAVDVTSITSARRWRELELQWPISSNDAESTSEDAGNVVVFGNFHKDES